MPSYPFGEKVSFDMLNLPFDPHGTAPSKAIRDDYAYVRYSQSTQGHLNSQGLCFVSRNFPSPSREF
jgi:hypothetical protein